MTVLTAPIPFYDGIEKPQTEDESGWWLDLIRARLSRYEPLPDDAEERKLLLYRVAMELFGNPVSSEINDSFVNDREPTALDSLAKRLRDRPGTTPFTGSLVSGPTTFRVLPVDPEAAKRPRTVHNPGWYTLGEKIVLSVTRRPVGERIANEASIRFFPDDPAQPAPGEPYELKLPDGYNTWAAAWMRGGTALWVRDNNGLRSYDFSDPKAVRETQIDAENATTVPEPIRDALNNRRIESAAPPRTQPPATTRPAPTEDGAAAAPPDDALWKTKVPFRDIPVTITNWSEQKDGLRIGLRAVADDGWRIGRKVRIELWLHNPSTRDVSFKSNPGRADVGLSVIAKDSEGQDRFAEPGNVEMIAIPSACTLPAGYVAKVKDFALTFDASDNEERAWFSPKFRNLEPGRYKLRCIWSDAHPSVSAAADWTGDLTTGELEFTLAAYVAPEPAYSRPLPATDTPK